MSQDIERLLNQVTPPDLPPELRDRVLAAVNNELTVIVRTPARSRPRSRPGLAAAAALLVSLVLNHVVNTTVDRRLAEVLGPRPVPQQAAEIAADIATLTSSQTGKWAFDRFTADRGREGDTQLYFQRLKLMIDQLTAETREDADETLQEDLQMDRDRRGRSDRHPPGAQRILRLEHRNTA